MAEDQTLLDVFVRVLPHVDNDTVVKAAVDKTKAMFAGIAGGSVGPGAARATDELKRGFIEAKRYAEDLARESGSLYRIVKATGDLDIGRRFRDALNEFKTVQIQIRRGAQDKDPFALDRTLERLDQIKLKLRDIGGEALRSKEAGQAGQINANNQNKSGARFSNNAYQFGQAIEDAAVGFQLNGFQGAIRGSANNIAFILNDLSQMPKVQQVIGARFAAQLPLIAGIGSALAILVLPKLVAWLQSLNDVNAGFRDITKEIENAFEGRDFQIKTGIDNDALEKSVVNATSLKDILEKIRELSDQNASRRNELQSIFTGFDVKELALDSLTPLQNINDQFDRLALTIQKSGEEAVSLDGKIKALRGFQPINQIFGETFTEDVATAAGLETPEVAIAKLRNFRQEVFAVRSTIEDAVQKGKEGAATPETFIRAQRQLDEFRKNLKENIGRLELSQADQATALLGFEGIADNVGKDLKRAEELAKQTAENIGEQFEIAFEGARNKVRDLQNQLKLGEQISQGKNEKFDAELLTLNDQIDKGRLLVLESIQALREEHERSGIRINEEGLKAIQDSFELESQVNLKRLLQEEKILEAKKKGSQFTQLEDYAKRLQTNALSGVGEEDRRENIRRLEEAISRNSQRSQFADVAMASRVPPTPQEQAAGQAVAFEQALRVLMPPLFQILESQNGTTEAVKKARGVVAQ